MDRIKKLCGYLEKCKSFADVGCDHGYCTQYMLKNGLCESAVISDVSAKCLEKAEKLLSKYLAEGKVKPVCCNGLEKIDEKTDEILIAGMGGEEIINILKTAYIPRSFVLQPMRNVREVREFLISRGAYISTDEPFESGGKYYYVIKGKRSGGKNRYSEAELNFGLNLRGAATLGFLESELEKRRAYLVRGLSAETRARIEEEIIFFEGVLKGEIK